MTVYYELDQSIGTGFAASDTALSWWQSFTAGKTGTLGKVSVYATYAGETTVETTLKIYSGEGTSGTLLYEEDVSFYIASSGGASSKWVEFTLDTDVVPVTTGQQYTLYFSQTSANYWAWGLYDDGFDRYADGGSSRGSAYDYNLKTYLRYHGFTTSAVVQKTAQGNLTASAEICPTLTASAIIRRGYENDITAGAIIAATGAGSLGASAVVQKTGSGSLTATAFIQPYLTAAAIISKTATGSLTTAAIITTTGTGWLYGQAIITKTSAGGLTAAAWLYRTVAGSLDASALIGKTWSKTFAASAIIDRIEYITASAYIVTQRGADRGERMKLLYGNDKRNPKRMLSLADTDLTGKIFLREGGFTPEYGEQSILWSGQSLYTEGEDRIAGSAGNTSLSINYDLNGGSMTELGQIQRKINRFANEIKLRREKGEPVEKVWLEYRWADRLASLPAPFFGQLSHYYEVLNISPRMPGDLHGGSLVAGQAEACVLELTCSPYPEGLPQRVGNAVGDVRETDLGVLVGENTYVNRLRNPDFGHPTDWDYSWTRTDTTYVILAEETALWLSSGRAARIVNAHSSTAHGIYCSVTSSAGYTLGFRCRRPDGGEVTTADVAVYTNTGIVTPTIVPVPGSDWYLCYATGTSTSITGIGPAAMAQREIIVDNMRYVPKNDLVASFFGPDMLFAGWLGTEYDSNLNHNDGGISYEIDNELSGVFTLEGWVIPHASPPVSGGGGIFRYYVDSSNYIWLRGSPTTIYLERRYAGVSVDDTESFTFDLYEPLHVALVQDHGSLSLYINGEVLIALSTGPGMATGGTLYFGCDSFSTYYSDAPMNLIFDGWRGFRVPLSAAQIGYLHDNELPIKESGGKIGPMPYLWTKDGDGELDNYSDGDDYENWAILAGVAGDLAAQVEWRFTPSADPNAHGMYWLGRKAIALDAPEVFTPYGTVHIDRDGTAQSGATGGEYSALDCTTTYDETDMLETAAQPRFLRGRWRFMAGAMFYTQDGYLKPAWRPGTAELRTGEALAIDKTTTAYLFSLKSAGNWDMLIDWPAALGDNPARIDWGFQRKGEDATADVWTDWYQLLPYPLCRVSLGTTIDVSSGSTLVVSGTEAYQEATNGYPLDDLEHEGDNVTVQPGFNNYIFMMSGGGESPDYSVFINVATVTLSPIITPRWLIAGGPAA